MKRLSLRIALPIAAAALAFLGGAAQAQTVIVVNPDNAAELRATVETSMRAAQRGERVGLITGRRNPEAMRVDRTAIQQELDATTLMYSVARVGADGKIERVCVNGSEAAQKALATPAFAKRLTPAKEHLDVK